MKTAIMTTGKVILAVSLGLIMAFLMIGSITEPPHYEAAAVRTSTRSEEIHEFVNDAPVLMETDTVELSTEKSTTQSTGLSYISTELSTMPVENAESVAEPQTYNGITEGDVITGEITYYCLCLRCCNKTDGITASGYVLENGVQSYTASCNWLPFGAVIELDGVEYTILDRGGKRMNEVGRIDIYEPYGHAAALENGRRKGVDLKVVSLP